MKLSSKCSFLIQGIFFLSAEYGDPKSGYDFYGVISSPKNEPDKLGGMLKDRFGGSILDKVEITDFSIKFRKTYGNTCDSYSILYAFQRNSPREKIWTGSWKYENGDPGGASARCIITEMPDAFWDHAATPKELSMEG